MGVKMLPVGLIALMMVGVCTGVAYAGDICLKNEYAKLTVSSDGRVTGIIDRATGTDFAAAGGGSPIASVLQNGKSFAATSVKQASDGLAIAFGESGVEAKIKVTPMDGYFACEVTEVNTDKVQELTFVDIPLSKFDPSFSCATLAMNIRTKVPSLPGESIRMVAGCIPKLGMVGAKVALILSPRDKMRSIMKRVITSVKNDVPYNTNGGPWAQDSQCNRGSYIVDCWQMREDTVDGWIKVCNGTGIRQIDFSNWNFFDGEYDVDPNLIPGGKDALKRIIKKLHAQGIKCGLHTYSFLVAKNSKKYLTPSADPRLAKSATFSLANDINESDKEISVQAAGASPSESNHVLRIDGELIQFGSAVTAGDKITFTGCTRGAFGSKAGAHKASAAVDNLKEVYDMFLPDVNTTLFKEVADNIARVYNECGFDMIYLDAVDSYGLLDGDDTGWYWATYFVKEITNQLKKPAIMEASTMWHGMWFARSRMGAWDVAIRGLKDDIDLHCAANRQCDAAFMPGHLGWLNAFAWDPIQPERTFPDDIEYLCCKCIGSDCGFSMQSYLNPENYLKSPCAQRYGTIIRDYEELRKAGYFSESVKKRLSVPGDEFSLGKQGDKWVLRPVTYAKHKVQGRDPESSAWSIDNTYSAQPVKVRIEALMSIDPYDSPDAVTLTKYGSGSYANPVQMDGVTNSSFTTAVHPELGRPEPIACFRAQASAAKATVAYKDAVTPMVDGAKKGLGVWVYGDGQGEVINFLTEAARPQSTGLTDHCAKIDHKGWRYFELVEPEMSDVVKYDWPGVPKKSDWDHCAPQQAQNASWYLYIMFGPVNTMGTLGMWYNNLPVGKEVTTYISPVKALPLKSAKLVNPTIKLNGKRLVFPVTLESGSYIEFKSIDDCKVYDAAGNVSVANLKPLGSVPTVATGGNQVSFTCETPGGESPRARITVITEGEPLENK